MRQHVFVIGAAEIGVVDGRAMIRGECDFANATEIESWLKGFGKTAIDVDLSAVTFFDASSLRAFVESRQRNPNIRIVKPSRTVRRVLELTDTYADFVDGRRR